MIDERAGDIKTKSIHRKNLEVKITNCIILEIISENNNKKGETKQFRLIVQSENQISDLEQTKGSVFRCKSGGPCRICFGCF